MQEAELQKVYCSELAFKNSCLDVTLSEQLFSQSHVKTTSQTCGFLNKKKEDTLKKEEDFRKEEDLRKEDYLIKDEHLKKDDDLKKEHDLKKEDNLKKEDDLQKQMT